MHNIVSRSEAKKTRDNRYYTGKPCKRGHIAHRKTHNGQCVFCAVEDAVKRYSLRKDRCREIARNFHYRHREKQLKKMKKYSIDNSEKEKARRKIYNENHREKRSLTTREWHKRNKEHTAAYRNSRKELYAVHARNRRAKQKCSGGSHTLSEIIILRARQRNRCALCKCYLDKTHVDHIVPICRGGSNDIRNIQILCPTCNMKKNRKDPLKFSREMGLLL